jgi:hypothetical protein
LPGTGAPGCDAADGGTTTVGRGGAPEAARGCAAAGLSASEPSAPNSIKDLIRLLIGTFNPFILNEYPRPGHPYTRSANAASGATRGSAISAAVLQTEH